MIVEFLVVIIVMFFIVMYIADTFDLFAVANRMKKEKAQESTNKEDKKERSQ